MSGESSSPPEYRLPFRRGWKVIELGGGEAPIIRPNVDSRWLPTVDLPGVDFNWPLPIPSASWDGVFSKFVLEHLSWRKVKGFMAECHRILKPGGIAVFVTANLEAQMKAVLNKEQWSEDDISMIFGGQEMDPWDVNAHHCGFSPAYTVKLFKEVGFYDVQVKPWPAAITDMVLECYKSAAVIV